MCGGQSGNDCLYPAMLADGESAFPSVGVPADELRFTLRVSALAINTEFDDVTVLIAGVALFTTR